MSWAERLRRKPDGPPPDKDLDPLAAKLRPLHSRRRFGWGLIGVGVVMPVASLGGLTYLAAVEQPAFRAQAQLIRPGPTDSDLRAARVTISGTYANAQRKIQQELESGKEQVVITRSSSLLQAYDVVRQNNQYLLEEDRLRKAHGFFQKELAAMGLGVAGFLVTITGIFIIDGVDRQKRNIISEDQSAKRAAVIVSA